MADQVQFDMDALAVARAADEAGIDDFLQEIGDEVARRAATLAPKRTGLGAQSIHAEVHRGYDVRAFSPRYRPPDLDPTAYVSWDEEHYYMLFAEEGTEHERARPFLRPALEQVQI